MANTTLSNSLISSKWDTDVGLGYQPLTKKHVLTLRDGTPISLELPFETFELKSNGKPHYNNSERAGMVQEAFRRQYEMSFGEIMQGTLAHIAGGASLGTSDEMAGFVEGFLSGPEAVGSAIDRQRTVLQKLSLKYPYLAMGAATIGAVAPVILDVIFGSRGLLSVPAAGTVVSRAATTGIRDLLHPFRIATGSVARAPRQFEGVRNVTLSGLEGAAKGGVLAGAHEYGAAEGEPGERWRYVPESFKTGAALGGGFTAALMAGARVPEAWRAAKEFGVPTLLRRGTQAINRNVMDYAGRVHQALRSDALTPEGESVTLSPEAQTRFAQSLFSENIPPSVAFRAATDPDLGGGPWGSLVGPHTRPLLSESLGLNLRDPSTGMPIRDPHLPSLLQWGSQADRLAGGRLAGRLEARAMNEPDRIQAALRRQHGPFPFDQTKALGRAREDAREVWEVFYRDAYFNPKTGDINTVPLAGTKDVAGSGFIRMFQDDSELYKKIYKQAVKNRSTAIAHPSGGWPRHIDGVSQQLPSWEMFLAGERWIPTSTWGDHARILTVKGWNRVKNPDGSFLIDDGNFAISNKGKQVEVKTLHDMRIAFDDLIAAEAANPGRQAQLSSARNDFNVKFQKVAPDDMAKGDEAFSNQKGVELAGQSGLQARTGEYANPDTIRRTMEGLKSPIEKRMFLSGFAQKMKADGVTAEDILGGVTLRNNVRAIFPKGAAGDKSFGDFLAEVSASRRMAHTRADIGDPARGTMENIGQQFSSLMWTLFAKVPAYKFSAMFAGARDLTTIARNVEKGQNQIVGQEIARILSAETPEQFIIALRKLDAEYMRTLPKEALELRQIAALMEATLAKRERELGPEISRTARGLLDLAF